MRKLLLAATGLLALGTVSAKAAAITGTLNLTGSGGANFGSNAITFTDSGLGNVTFGNQTGSFSVLSAGCSNCATFGQPTTTAGINSFTYSPLSPSAPGNVIYSLSDTVGTTTYMSNLTLTSVTFAGAGNSGNYSLEGTGVLTLTGFDATMGTFDLTFQGGSANASFSATSAATAVPEPASMALLGAGLFGIGMVRRRARKG